MTSAPVSPATPLTSAEVAAWYEASDELCKMISGDSFHYGMWQPDDFGEPLPARQLATRAQNRMTDFFCDLLAIKPGEHLLDVGCGHGSPALHAARERRIQVTGCSISRAQITEAIRRAAATGMADRVRFAFGDAMDLPHESGRFDAVWALDSFPHLNDPVQGLGELARTARPGAPILVTFYTQRVPATDAELMMCREAFAFCPLPTHEQVLGQIRAAGLTLEQTHDMSAHIAPTCRAYERIYQDNRALIAEKFGVPYAAAMDTALADTLTFLTDKTGYLACLLRHAAHS
ncbi:SAM-dependent methyltransferase [Streptomyces melanogenes]|uniref:SAM-dependent methyltransferase n=1 Tax=Streptomyces melanogenes TaxID=67326 RepID=UPI00167CF9F5|nr:class I SAM-dependent methyltransferase [Streptomyces melanogenes]GGP86450.1 methyltransferase type 11 [Streptomyces melanogenes]